MFLDLYGLFIECVINRGAEGGRGGHRPTSGLRFRDSDESEEARDLGAYLTTSPITGVKTHLHDLPVRSRPSSTSGCALLGKKSLCHKRALEVFLPVFERTRRCQVGSLSCESAVHRCDGRRDVETGWHERVILLISREVFLLNK